MSEPTNNDWSKKYLDDLNAKIKANKDVPKSATDHSPKEQIKPQVTPKDQPRHQQQQRDQQNNNKPQRDNQRKESSREGNRNNPQDKRFFSEKPFKKNFQNNRNDRDRKNDGRPNDPNRDRNEQKKNNNLPKKNEAPRKEDRRGGQQRPQDRDRRPESKPPVVQKNRVLGGYICGMNGSVYTVLAENKEYTCTVQEYITRQGPLYIGDRVRIQIQPEMRGVIEKYEPRQNFVLAPGARERQGDLVLAANVNQIVLVLSVMEPVLRTDWLDRHLLVCERKGFKPLIVCHKIDLADDNMFLEQMEVYKQMGYRVIFTSSAVLSSVNELKAAVKQKTSLFTGHQGVGKTTLAELILEEESARLPDNPEEYDLTIVDDIVETTRQVHCLRGKEGIVLIDTPGVTEYEISSIEKKDLKKYFRDFRNYNHQCSIPDCNHADEPNCKVKKAVETGEISEERYQNYLNILDSLTV
ncbi:MAG TPA: ribosome small subunit-dependent GTPase A [bacterium]|nr:ribosome small subunit-dependent GTPase A [bacterium]